MSDLNDFKCPFIPIEKIHEKADTFRDKYWERDDLPVDIELIIEKMGLDIIPTANLKDIDIDAYLKIDLKGTIPALLKSSVASSGTKGADATKACPFDSK